MKTVKLENNLVILRKLSLEDVQDFYEYVSDKKTTDNLDWEIDTIKQSTLILEAIIRNYDIETMPHWGIVEKNTNKLIGRCSVSKFYTNDSTVEIGYSISSKFWSRGYMTNALDLAVKYIFSLGINRVEAMVIERNISSKKVLEKCGFQKEGLLLKRLRIKNNYHNAEIWSKLNG